jgi:ABC-2 type transport system permease protein
MSQWFTLLKKEIVEMWRNFKWIWVPITFILIGVQKPITTYYTPQILKAVGNIPKEVIAIMPTPTPREVLVQGFGEYTSLGVLIIVLVMMGTIAAERKSGVAAMILVKPVSYPGYVTAKWAGGLMLVWFSFFIGALSVWYYTGILFKWIPFGEFFQIFCLYGLWFTFILTMTVFFSACVLSPGIAAFASLAVAIVFSIAGSILSNVMEWSPSQLTNYANELVLKKAIPDDTLPASLITAACIIVLLVLSTIIFRKKELAS